MPAPVALFVYARPEHTRKTVEALQENKYASDTDLVVFSDAAGTPDEQEAVACVRNYVDKIEGFKTLSVHYRSQNYGLARSITCGVSDVLRHYGRVIVLEDDMVTSRFFLQYMNEALDRFAEDDRVISIHGYMFPVKQSLPEPFFLLGADCWGWATWARGWSLFNPDGQMLLDELRRRKLTQLFDINGSYPYTKMLEEQTQGKNDSWAVRWHASAFLAGKLTLYPGRSLVHNIGNDITGTHCGISDAFDVEPSATPVCLEKVVVEESVAARKIIQDFLRAKRKRPSLNRFLTHFIPGNVRRRAISLAKDILPPLLANWLRRLSCFGGRAISFDGPFITWEEAAKHSSGYDAATILDKVLSATLKVQRGEAVYERDSVVFDEIQYAWPVTAGLLWVAAHDGGRLSVLDFGGSLGSSFFQNRSFLEGLRNVRWSVVEQPHFVATGREFILDQRLFFYSTIAECLAFQRPNVALLSGVLQYLEDPYKVLDEVVHSDVDIILVDRTSLHDGDNDIIFVQKVEKTIYPASYPMWAFSKNKLMNRLSPFFDVVAEELSPEGFVDYSRGVFSFNGFILQRRQA